MNMKKYLFAKGAYNKIPVSGTFELTARCNFDCKMCYIHSDENDTHAMSRELSAAQWIDIGRQAVNKGMIYLLMTGGEPLLRKDFSYIYTEMAKMGVIISINTNASCITQEILDCFHNHPPERINVTIYGSSEETYTSLCQNNSGYKKSIEGILKLKNSGFNVIINTTFTHYNKNDIFDLVAFSKEHNIPIRTASYIFPPVRKCGSSEDSCFLSPEEMGCLSSKFDILTMNNEQKQRRIEVLTNITEAEEPELTDDPVECSASSCMAGKGAFWITWDGLMLPCGMINGFWSEPLKYGFQNAWNEITKRTESMFLPKDCTDCQYKKICPSCAAIGFARNGDPSVLAPEMCKYIKTYCKSFLNAAKS